MISLTNAGVNSQIAIIALAEDATTSGTFEFDETSAVAQTVTTLTVGDRTAISGIWLDMSNVTQNTTIALLHQIDGTNYAQFQSQDWTAADADGILIDGFVAAHDVRLTFICAGGGGATVDVPFVIV